MKKVIKVSIILIILLTEIFVFPSNFVRAETVSNVVGGMAPSTVNPTYYSNLQTVIGMILGFLQIASGLTTVIMVAFLGFKFLTETPEVKGQVKEKFLPIIIGIVLVFGATSISKFIIGVAA